MTTVLERLSNGPKPYEELPYSPTLDFQLTRLLSEGKIVRVYNRGVLYSLPIVPPPDTPANLPKWKPRKPDKRKKDQRNVIEKECKTCKIVKGILEFPRHSNTFRYNTCRPCMLTARRARVANGGNW